MSQVRLFPTPPINSNGYNNDRLPSSFPPNTMSTAAHTHTHTQPMRTSHTSHDNNIQYLTAKELINIKIRKRNLCYVVGLPIHVAAETKLRTQEWFGQFGNIATIAINRNSKSIQANSILAHITYDNDISALNAINFWFIAANKKCSNLNIFGVNQVILLHKKILMISMQLVTLKIDH